MFDDWVLEVQLGKSQSFWFKSLLKLPPGYEFSPWEKKWPPFQHHVLQRGTPYPPFVFIDHGFLIRLWQKKKHHMPMEFWSYHHPFLDGILSYLWIPMEFITSQWNLINTLNKNHAIFVLPLMGNPHISTHPTPPPVDICTTRSSACTVYPYIASRWCRVNQHW